MSLKVLTHPNSENDFYTQDHPSYPILLCFFSELVPSPHALTSLCVFYGKANSPPLFDQGALVVDDGSGPFLRGSHLRPNSGTDGKNVIRER